MQEMRLMDLIVPFHLKFARSCTSDYIYIGQRSEISGSSVNENILINISPDKNTIALYVHDTEGNLLSVNDSWYRTMCSAFVWSPKFSLWEILIWELMPWLHSSLMKSYTKGISNTINHKPPPWNLFLGAHSLHYLPKLLSSKESIQQALKLNRWFFFPAPKQFAMKFYTEQLPSLL